MKKTDITDIRRLAGLQQLNENYIYAAEEEEESTEETEEALEEIDGDEEGMAAESEVQESSEEDEEELDEDDMEEGNEFTGALAKAKASNQDHFEVDGKKYTVKEAEMSRAAKGHEKYGKEGMKALAKAGKDGKDLDKIRDKYNKYDESVGNKVDEDIAWIKDKVNKLSR
jgi:hypothetical protein